MKIAGFMKVRNEILRGNLYRALDNIEAVCDCGVLCDDASSDGTAQVLRDWVAKRPGWQLIEVPAAEQDFRNEMAVKQRMLDRIHSWVDKPDWIWWLDADEEVESAAEVRGWLDRQVMVQFSGVKFHYTQLWRSRHWARTDSGFDEGLFCKLWRYSPDLSFDVSRKTHNQQFPKQIDYAACPVAPFEIIHWGNADANRLKWKAIQYAHGLGGIDRHIAYGHTPEESMAVGVGYDQAHYSESKPTYRYTGTKMAAMTAEPKPFTLGQIKRIRSFGALKKEEGLFVVICPTFNRSRALLSRALDSLQSQTYDHWICIVLDDGSTNDTESYMHEVMEADPRFFYARYETNRGGVAMNEIGMALACEFGEFWARLGSDDYWGPTKLALDVKQLHKSGACYGAYSVIDDDQQLHETCNPPMIPDEIKESLHSGRFLVSWANCAIRCDVLEKVRGEFGSFCDPHLRNCEDFLVNARVAHFADWTWRGAEPLAPLPVHQAWNYPRPAVLEAVWRRAPTGGASSAENALTLAADEALTRSIIKSEVGRVR